MKGQCSIAVVLWCIVVLMFAPATAQSTTLDGLLQEVRASSSNVRGENQAREARFGGDHQTLRAQLHEAQTKLAAQEQRSDALQDRFQASEILLAELEQALHERQGSLGELFGVVRQAAGDLNSHLGLSLTSAQFPDRSEAIAVLAERKELPSIHELETLWITLFEEMTESGKVSRFDANVIGTDGTSTLRSVTRVGTFNAVADGRYLNYQGDAGHLVEFARQPAGRYLRDAEKLTQAGNGEQIGLYIDPSRGALLGQLVLAPNLLERIQQGRWVGYVILILGAVGLAIFLERFWVLTLRERSMKRQLSNPHPDESNPVGRIMAIHAQHKDADPETLELRMDEAIINETPRIERGLATIKLLAAVAPLLGLLGTVVGMIETFQSITLFGTGDPKLMASGISQALVTTALGLVVAIPLLLLVNIVAAKARRLIGMLDEQGAGILAMHMEKGRSDEPVVATT